MTAYKDPRRMVNGVRVGRREDIAWCAGFFDGEGCFYLAKSKRNAYMRAVVVQKDVRLLKRFHQIVGLGVISKPNKRGVHYLTINNSTNTLALYEMLAAYMGPQKDEQFRKKLTEYLDTRKITDTCFRRVKA